MTIEETIKEMESVIRDILNPYNDKDPEAEAWSLVVEEGWHKQQEGKWIVAKTERAWNDAEYPYMHKCSLCGNEIASQDLTPYCAYCGAKMIEEENDDE